MQVADATQQERMEQIFQLREVLILLSDYKAVTEVCIGTFKSLNDQPDNLWVKSAHQYVVDATFHASDKLSVHELIECIVQNAPNIFFYR